jgi:hypothetical protein
VLRKPGQPEKKKFKKAFQHREGSGKKEEEEINSLALGFRDLPFFAGGCGTAGSGITDSTGFAN